MRRYFELLQEIERSPRLFVGADDLHFLSLFLSGAHIALKPEERIPQAWDNFHMWVRTKLFGDQYGAAYYESILSKCEGDQKRGIQLFFDLMREYRLEMEVKYPDALG